MKYGLAIISSTIVSLLAGGCSDPPATPEPWTVVHEDLPPALMSIWGTSPNDVWAVGADLPGDADGPLVLHWDGVSWTRKPTGTTGDLWWVFGFPGGPVYMGGKGGQILRYANDVFTTMLTPGPQTIYGIWGASPDDLWAVGADDGGASGGFAWRLEGETWVPAAQFPATASEKAVWKIHGTSKDDVWMVGTAGLAIHWDGTTFEEQALGSTSLFTVHCTGARCVTVGGFATEVIWELDGGAWRDVSTAGNPPLVGVCTTPDVAYAVGDMGAVLEQDATSWTALEEAPTNETLHAVWVDPDGGIWAVGGRVRVAPLRNGVLVYRGDKPPAGAIE